jgi:hypothetical protein
MTIGPDGWNAGRTEAVDDPRSAVTDRLLEFLELNRGKAHTAEELGGCARGRYPATPSPARTPPRASRTPPDHTTFQRFLGRISETVSRRSGTVDAALREPEAEGAIESKMVETVDGLSGRADRQGLENFVRIMNPRPEKVLCVHGDQSSVQDPSSALYHEFNIRIFAPKELETFRSV